MLGLTYAQAQGRYDARRALVVKEANAIGTTWLRADQLAPHDTLTFRRLLTEYTRERLGRILARGKPNGTHRSCATPLKRKHNCGNWPRTLYAYTQATMENRF